MKQLTTLSRWLFGLVFIFSGFVKGIDPHGLEYKLVDYLNAAGLTALTPLALVASWLLPFAEFFIGATLLLCVRIRISSLFGLIFMAFFTPFTLYVALRNPVTDCGCFGDALVITNWETFFKNILLSAMILLVFLRRKAIEPAFLAKWRPYRLTLLTTLYAGFVIWSAWYEPVFDFRPYKMGVNIPAGMKMPPGMKGDEYSNTFLYRNKKSNEVKKFTDKNYPWQDTLNWKFESMGEAILVKKGYTPPIHDFQIRTAPGDDVTSFFFADDKPTFFLIAPNLQKSSLRNQGKINGLAVWARFSGYKFVCLTSTTGKYLEDFKMEAKPTYDFLFCDEVTLKTILRSNPGLLYLKSGTILGKWSHNALPSTEEMTRILGKVTK
ncbi:MAG: DoxX family protein [Marinilabiliales bacterium]|nr:DoxX family protein [Marinilabiliales bacterium]